MKNRILFIEEQPDLSDILRIYLENNYYLAYSPTSSDALHRLENDDSIKLIIFNDDPPYSDGLNFLKSIRKAHITTPFILLSDNDEIKNETEIIKNALFLPKHADIEALLQIIKTIIPQEQKERRKFPRVDINKQISIKDSKTGEYYSGSLDNISLGGMRVKLNDFAQNFEDDTLEIEFNDMKITLSKVTTVYSEEKQGILMGIEFDEINESTFQKIQDLISRMIIESIITKESLN